MSFPTVQRFDEIGNKGIARFDIMDVDKIDLLKAFWDREFDDCSSKQTQGKFDYNEAEKAVNGYVGMFCERLIDVDFSVYRSIEIFYTDEYKLFCYAKLIRSVWDKTFVSYAEEQLNQFKNSQEFFKDFQRCVAEFEFTHKKCQTLTGEYVPKMFQLSFTRFDPVEFDNFYGRGSFESILEDIAQKYATEGEFYY
jgi:hypothetical protein